MSETWKAIEAEFTGWDARQRATVNRQAYGGPTTSRGVAGMSPDVDNRLALGQLIERCERVGIEWMLSHDRKKVTPEFRYELRIFEGPARAIYHGRTATHAASKAMAALDEHRIGWTDA